MRSSSPLSSLTRREALTLAAVPFLQPARRTAAKRVIVSGAGIAGLSCAWELQRRGHDVHGAGGVQPHRRPRVHLPRGAR